MRGREGSVRYTPAAAPQGVCRDLRGYGFAPQCQVAAAPANRNRRVLIVEPRLPLSVGKDITQIQLQLVFRVQPLKGIGARRQDVRAHFAATPSDSSATGEASTLRTRGQWRADLRVDSVHRDRSRRERRSVSSFDQTLSASFRPKSFALSVWPKPEHSLLAAHSTLRRARLERDIASLRRGSR